MIKLKQQYNKEIVKMMNQLVTLGARLSECKQINENLVTPEYKWHCIDEINKEIAEVKQKMIGSIISLVDSSKLEIK
jgi:hypothetical protein